MGLEFGMQGFEVLFRLCGHCDVQISLVFRCLSVSSLLLLVLLPSLLSAVVILTSASILFGAMGVCSEFSR